MFEACHAILALEAESGRDALDENSTTIFHLYRFLSEYENGGLTGYLRNIAPAWDDLAQLCDIVVGTGYAELAHALVQVHSIVARGPADPTGNWDEWLRQADPDGTLSGLDETISEGYDLLWHELEELTPEEDEELLEDEVEDEAGEEE